jgi:hypothetical protein
MNADKAKATKNGVREHFSLALSAFIRVNPWQKNPLLLAEQ